MKNTLSILVAIAASIFLYACQSDTSSVMKPDPKPTELNTISQATYDTLTGAWHDVGAGYTDSVLTKYFTMENIDLQEFAKHQHYAARFVLGMDTTGGKFYTHLLLVGVDSLGNSMIPSNGYAKNNIYDVTRPCPHYCGSSGLEKPKK